MPAAGELRAAPWKVWRRAHAPTDTAALAAFRVLFGLVGTALALRFLAMDGVRRFYERPTFFFHYDGMAWVRPLPAPWMHLVFVGIAVAGVLVALGLFYRAAVAAFFLLFTYAELVDVTTYLNHYYLVSLLALILFALPLHASFSLDARRRPELRRTAHPAYFTWLLRFQVGIVYFFAALAKATPDWLFHAEPLAIWLGARTDLPLVGPYLDRIEVAFAMSWAGFLYDLTIPFWLSWRRSRPFAYAVVLFFHFVTSRLFDIGTFPLIMSTAALVFFSPSWPRALLRRAVPALPEASAPPLDARRRLGALALGLWCAFHVLVPLRAHAYGGNLLWHEQGMRWSWRVLCRVKTGSVTYRVRARGWDHERDVAPSRYLTSDQEREFAGQPDMILALAHHVAEDLRARGAEDVEVRADAWVSLNGRPRARLIDPDVDLARVESSILPAAWILPAPEGPPLSPGRRQVALAEVP